MHVRKRWLLLVALAALGLAGCGGDKSDTVFLPEGFTPFVKKQLDNTSDTSEPASINDRNFQFEALENPNAYDDVL